MSQEQEKDDRQMAKVLSDAGLSINKALRTMQARKPDLQIGQLGPGVDSTAWNIACDVACSDLSSSQEQVRKVAVDKGVRIAELNQSFAATGNASGALIETLQGADPDAQSFNIACDTACAGTLGLETRG